MIRSNAPTELQVDMGDDQARKDRVKKWTFVVIRSVVGLTLIVVLFKLVDVHSILNILGEADLRIFLFIIPLVLLDRILMALRWLLLLRAKTKDISAFVVIRVNFIASFFGNFLPFNVGSDVTRVFSLSKYSGNTLDILSSVIIDRAIGFFSLAIAVALSVTGGVIWQVSGISQELIWTVLIGLAVLGCLSFILWNGNAFGKKISALTGGVVNKWIKKIEEIYNASLSYKTCPNVIFKVFAICFLILFNGILVIYFTAWSLGIDVSLIYFFLFIPIISFLTLLPITPNAIGIVEGGFVFFFSQVGASTSEAFMLGLVMRVLTILATLPGGLLLAVEGWTCKRVSINRSNII